MIKKISNSSKKSKLSNEKKEDPITKVTKAPLASSLVIGKK